MKLLLDTHILLWALSDPARLTSAQRTALVDPYHETHVSAVSAWEIAIKQSLGKLSLPGPAATWLIPAVLESGFSWLAVTAEDAVRVFRLPWHHRDPFDRLLIAQANEAYVLVTQDAKLAAYDVSLLR
ncbi:MAG: type II toxin-antitoxin system VapC family toxin [Deltaproteobacteria bacterium]|nr:type II toxin-antitoxin system VapC family toxin [Deltaproteobacteria bacterium]